MKTNGINRDIRDYEVYSLEYGEWWTSITPAGEPLLRFRSDGVAEVYSPEYGIWTEDTDMNYYRRKND